MSAPPSPTHYETLQVLPDASTAQVREAWRRLAARHHPDRAGSPDPADMARINQAYGVLSDPHERACYDARLWPRAPRRLRTLRQARARARRFRLGLVALLPLALAGWALVRGGSAEALSPLAQPGRAQVQDEPPLQLKPSRGLQSPPAAPSPSR